MPDKVLLAILKPRGRVETERMPEAEALAELERVNSELAGEGGNLSQFVKLGKTAVVNKSEIRYVTIKDAEDYSGGASVGWDESPWQTL
jgi:hypothetical protein